MTPHAIRVFDDVLPDPEIYRAGALLCHYEDIAAGPAVFHGMAPIGESPLSQLLRDTFGLHITYSAFRLSPEGQEEPNYIHTDRDMGDWTAILYLSPEPPETDGTTFWRCLQTSSIQSTPEQDADEARGLLWRDLSQWEPWHTVAAQFNRVLLFPAPYFHSRAIHENWGHGDDARLIQICFGTGVLPCV